MLPGPPVETLPQFLLAGAREGFTWSISPCGHEVLNKANFSSPRVKNSCFQTGPLEHGCCPGNRLSRHIHPPGGFMSQASQASLHSVPCLPHPWSHPWLLPLLSFPGGTSGNTRDGCHSSSGRDWGEWGNPLPVCRIPEIQTYMPKPARPFIPKATWERDRDERSQGTLRNSAPQRKGFSSLMTLFSLQVQTWVGQV